MALLVTLFLVLVNIFNATTTNSPKADGLNALQVESVRPRLHDLPVIRSAHVLVLALLEVQPKSSDVSAPFSCVYDNSVPLRSSLSGRSTISRSRTLSVLSSVTQVMIVLKLPFLTQHKNLTWNKCLQS